MKTTAKYRQAHGYILTEMLIAVAIMGVLAVLVGDLFMISFGSMRKASSRDNLLYRMDAAIGSLRRDTWAAEKISMDAANHVDLKMPSGEQVSWRMSEKGVLSRTLQRKGEAAQNQTWPELPEIRFLLSSDGALLELSVRSAPGQDESLTLVSQSMLQGRKR
ncbi:MAG: type II secretion system GspH family protein [Phycisphaerales bacterium]|nr:type II secretion system GspH family protein [Phycisphaerales bacterium]